MIRQPNRKPDFRIDLCGPWHPIHELAVGAGAERVEPRHMHQRKDFRRLFLRKVMRFCRFERCQIPPPRKIRRCHQLPILRDPQLFGGSVVRYPPYFGNRHAKRFRVECGWRRGPELAAACGEEGSQLAGSRKEWRLRRLRLALPSTGRARSRTGRHKIGTVGLGGCNHVVRGALADFDSSGEIAARSIRAEGTNFTGKLCIDGLGCTGKKERQHGGGCSRHRAVDVALALSCEDGGVALRQRKVGKYARYLRRRVAGDQFACVVVPVHRRRSSQAGRCKGGSGRACGKLRATEREEQHRCHRRLGGQAK